MTTSFFCTFFILFVNISQPFAPGIVVQTASVQLRVNVPVTRGTEVSTVGREFSVPKSVLMEEFVWERMCVVVNLDGPGMIAL